AIVLQLWCCQVVRSAVPGIPSLPVTTSRLRATVGRSSPEPKPQFSEAKMPDEWPPSRVKKPWRSMAWRESSRASIMGPKRIGDGKSRCRRGDDLEQVTHLRFACKPFDGPADDFTVARRGVARQCRGPGLKSHRQQEVALGHRRRDGC